MFIVTIHTTRVLTGKMCHFASCQLTMHHQDSFQYFEEFSGWKEDIELDTGIFIHLRVKKFMNSFKRIVVVVATRIMISDILILFEASLIFDIMLV